MTMRRTISLALTVGSLLSGRAAAQEQDAALPGVAPAPGLLAVTDTTHTPGFGMRMDLSRASAPDPRLFGIQQQRPKGRGVPDSLPCPDCDPRDKHFLRASAELFVVWFVPWAVNYYVRDAPFAHISLNSWWDNITGQWVYDDNTFQTNQFAHPMHGAFYFNSFRANGYNFWASSAASWVGAFGWECCGETHPPAPNDLVNTAVGGMTLGEMMWRLSTLALDNTSTGSGRTWHEIGGFLMSPWNGFNRWVTGRSNDVVANPPSWRPAWVQGSLDVGPRILGTKGNSADVFDSTQSDFTVGFRLVYGRPIQDLDGRPFSTFQMNGEIATGDRQKLQVLQVRGSLGGKELHNGEKATHMLAAMLHYDYNFVPNRDTAFNAVVFEYGGQSISGGLQSVFRMGHNWQLITNASLRAVLMGAVRADYYEITGEGRNYDFGPGAGGILSATLARPRLLFTMAYNGTYIHTVNGTDYDHYLDQGSVDARYYFSRRVGAGIRYDYFHRNSRASDAATAPGPNTQLTVPQLRLFVATAIPRWGAGQDVPARQ